MPGLDVDSFLQNGFWQNTRARNTDPDVFDPHSPRRPPSYVDPTAPRTLPFRVGRPRDTPPPPSVEDEIDALAKEHGSVISSVLSEEPPNRGEVEQDPILLEVHEHNPERRFVLVAGSSESSDNSPETENKARIRAKSWEPRAETYEANTGRKYDTQSSPGTGEPDRKQEVRPSHDRRRSKLEGLPTIVTDTTADLRPHDSRKVRSATVLEQTTRDDSSRKERSRSRAESMLSPGVIEHATKGRDRPYYGGGSGPNSHRRSYSDYPQERRATYESKEGRNKDNGPRAAHSTSPTFAKRNPALEVPTQTRRSSKESYVWIRDAEPATARLERKNSTRSYARSERGSISRRPPDYRDPRESALYDSSGDESRRKEESRRRKSFARDDRKDYLETPVDSRSSGRRRSQLPSPGPSPRESRSFVYDNHSSSAPRSSTYPKESKTSGDDRPERPLSRASTVRSTVSNAASVMVPAVIAGASAAGSESGTPTDRREFTLSSRPRTELRSERSSTSTLSSGSSKQNWQPPKFQPSQNGSHSSHKPVTAYRRHSEDVKAGELPNIPDCPRTQAEAGHMDWLTFPRCDNFNICPSCYHEVFSRTEFAHCFVPAPFRPRDRPLACDFGTSQWYQLAWLMTHKYKKTDLALFQNIANLLARSQPCTGFRESYRIWYSIRNPRTQRPVRGFAVCQPCAGTLEILLPSLTGVFVPLDLPPEPSPGACSMHPQDTTRRSVDYFDTMEAAVDAALATGCAPDLQDLADRIADLCVVPECGRGRASRDARWYIMRSAPDFTVCEECFADVVSPALEWEQQQQRRKQQQRDDRDRDYVPAPVAGDFYHRPQRLPLAACQLHSDRMRDVFDKAVRRRDLAYLEGKTRERRAREQEYHAKIAALDRPGYDPAWVGQEAERLLEEWKRFE
ncbi:hypothetical protein DL763_003448 [Monosporascus cannonballus]|nr:hypothetical protein DL763_003448 [Monosporascus cannonballus]